MMDRVIIRKVAFNSPTEILSFTEQGDTVVNVTGQEVRIAQELLKAAVPSRLEADSEEVLIADRWQVLISVARDGEGAPKEVVFKGRDRAAKSGTDIEQMFHDLGVWTSRLLQGRRS